MYAVYQSNLGKGGIINISDASMWNSVVHETVKAHPQN